MHWWTGERIDGPAHVLAHAPLGQPALYARANTPIPLWPELETTAGAPPDTLTWFVHAVAGAPAGSGELYEDAGDGYGESARRSATAETDEDGRVTVRISEREGGYDPGDRRVVVEVPGRGTAEVAESAGGTVIER